MVEVKAKTVLKAKVSEEKVPRLKKHCKTCGKRHPPPPIGLFDELTKAIANTAKHRLVETVNAVCL